MTLLSRAYKLLVVTLIISGGDVTILGDPGAVSRDDTMFVVKVYCKIETSPWNQFQKHLNCLLLIGQKFFFSSGTGSVS